MHLVGFIIRIYEVTLHMKVLSGKNFSADFPTINFTEKQLQINAFSAKQNNILLFNLVAFFFKQVSVDVSILNSILFQTSTKLLLQIVSQAV